MIWVKAMRAWKINPAAIKDWLKQAPAEPVFSVVDISVCEDERRQLEMNDPGYVAETLLLPSRKWLLSYSGKPADNWMTVPSHSEPIPGPVIAYRLDDKGEVIDIDQGEPASCLHQKTIVGWDRYQWSMDTGFRRLSMPALHHWYATLPQFKDSAHILDL